MISNDVCPRCGRGLFHRPVYGQNEPSVELDLCCETRAEMELRHYTKSRNGLVILGLCIVVLAVIVCWRAL